MPADTNLLRLCLKNARNMRGGTEFNKLIPELKIFLNHLVDNEPLTDTSKEDCIGFIGRLDSILKPPSLPPRSGKNSTTQQPIQLDLPPTENTVSSPIYLKGDEFFNGNIPTDYINKEKQSGVKNTEEKSNNNNEAVSNGNKEESGDGIYQTINENADKEDTSKPFPPPRLNRAIAKGSLSPPSPRSGSYKGLKIVDLPHPTYSGLLRNVTSNTKQWCVIKHQKLFLFNDLNEPAAFVADLTKYEVIKDPHDMHVFRVTQHNEPSIILAAVDENQYEIWHDAFKKAKLSHLTSPITEEKPYLSLPGFPGDENNYEQDSGYERPTINEPRDQSAGYIREVNPIENSIPQYKREGRVKSPERVISPEVRVQSPDSRVTSPELGRVISPDGLIQTPDGRILSPDGRALSPEDLEDLYVSMGPIGSPRPTSPPIYESITPFQRYHDMDLPPTPGEMIQEDKEAPPLPKRRPAAGMGTANEKSFEQDDDSDSDESLNDSSESLGVKSDTELDKSRERDDTGQSWNYTLDKNVLKGLRSSKEVEFMRDLTATYCGILHQRRMLAVWQKRYCKVRDQSLLCFRTPEENEPSLSLSLQDYQLDRAEEAWRSFAFKIFKEPSEVYYFAAVNRAEQIRWLNVLAKAINKEKFNSLSKLDSERKSQTSTELMISSEDSFDSNESLNENQSEEADAESESEQSQDMQRAVAVKPRNKHLHPAQKAARRNRARAASLEDIDAEMQGYLYKRIKNHWYKRWCVIKEKRFLSYKQNPKERPEEAILLEYAALTTPNDPEHVAANYFMFKLRFEGEANAVFRTKKESDLERWLDCIKKYVGSTSEESFPYINVPPTTPEKKLKTADEDSENPNYSTIVDREELSIPPPLKNFKPGSPSKMLPQIPSATPSLPSLPNEKEQLLKYNQRRRHAPSWSETEIEDSYMNGKLTELQICNQSFRHIERFVIITREKWFKVYEAINSTTPILVFNALDIEVKEESGADPSVLHLLLGNVQVELLLKATDKDDCDLWKDIFERIHYEDVDDDVIDGDLPLRNRSRSIEKEPSPFGRNTASKTMPNLGKRKKLAKEMKQNHNNTPKLKSLPHQHTVDSPPTASSVPRRRSKAFTLIRSWTIDPLGRKAKNKPFEVPREQREEDIVLKETQRGVLKQLLKDDEGNEYYEDRFCRIRGKIFQCFANETETTKPLFKIPLRNAMIEEFVNPGTGLFSFKISSNDAPSNEYTFALDNESELDSWTAAFDGFDQLHKSANSLENSPQVPRRVSGSTFYAPASPASPVSLRTSIGSKDSVTEEDEELQILRNRSLTDPFVIIEDNESLTGSLGGQSKNTSATASQLSMDVQSRERVDTPDSQSNDQLSVSSFSSGTTTRSEVDGGANGKRPLSKSLSASKLKPLSEESIRLSSAMFELSNSDLSQTKSKRWVVLRKTVLELYKGESDKYPLHIVQLVNVEICDEESNESKEKNQLVLKLDDPLNTTSGTNKIYLVAPDENTRSNFTRDIKKASRSLKRQKNPRHSVTLQLKKRLGSAEKLKEFSSKKDKRISMLLVDDDVKAIEKYQETADPSNSISGRLKEYFDETAKSSKEKDRFCWIQNGWFYISKIGKSKPVKTIDLSTVVVLDESEQSIGKHAFKLEYTNSNEKRCCVYLKALDAGSADKWMVAVSMGILYHRLTGGSTSGTQNKELDEDPADFDFGPLPIDSGKPRSDSEIVRDISMRKEIASKLVKEDPDAFNMVKNMLDDEKDGDGPQPPQPPQLSDENKGEALPDESVEMEDVSKDQAKRPTELNIESLPELKKQLSHLNDDEDQVFNDGVTDQSFELLDNIPDKENADETFRNVKGILHQQESIRRTILKNQREKRVPPPVKRKPSKLILRKPTFTQDTVLYQCGPLDALSLNKLHTYAEKIELEKSALSKYVRALASLISESVILDSSKDSSASPTENSVTEAEYKVLTKDHDKFKERLGIVEKELKSCRIHITRKTASKSKNVISPELLKRAQMKGGRATPQIKSDDDEDEKGGENKLMRETPGRASQENEEDTDSIII
ncbi:uncharacterized protein [Clytia hemisphaerica]|uniref:uncharacterized protein isoform X1 n=1 Tax=Clytia hemisphaerica TaxID=252671 RepID=UPI0034D5CFED